MQTARDQMPEISRLGALLHTTTRLTANLNRWTQFAFRRALDQLALPDPGHIYQLHSWTQLDSHSAPCACTVCLTPTRLSQSRLKESAPKLLVDRAQSSLAEAFTFRLLQHAAAAPAFVRPGISAGLAGTRCDWFLRRWLPLASAASGTGLLRVRMPQLRFAMICAANVNRSMEAHKLLKEAGLQVQSFGVNTRVKLPGESADSPNQYDFDSVSYSEIYNDLKQKNQQHYTQKGILGMLQRNMGIKKGPQRWQNHRDVSDVDVAITFEERILEKVVADMNERNGCSPVLVVNMDVKDRHEESALAAPHVLQLCQMLEAAEDWEVEADSIMEEVVKDTGMKPLYTICFA